MRGLVSAIVLINAGIVFALAFIPDLQFDVWNILKGRIPQVECVFIRDKFAGRICCRQTPDDRSEILYVDLVLQIVYPNCLYR